MRNIIFVAIAGALGALSRYGLATAVQRMTGSTFPYGTLVVNVAGCFLLGFFMHIAITTDVIPPAWRIAVTVGFLGALTTFATFSYETVGFIADSAWTVALGNIAANLILGLVGTIVGIAISRTLFGGA